MFWRTHLTVPPACAWPICAGDLDGDKDLDLVVGGDQGNQIRWYENTTTGLLNGSMKTPEGRYKTGWYLPETYQGDQGHELLIVLPGDAHMRAYQILRDFLIPVSESRNNLILSVDLPRTQSPYTHWENDDYLHSIIDYAKSGFGIDENHIYVMGFTNQGQAVMHSALSENLSIRGFIGFNPLIPSLDLGAWTDPQRPIVSAISDSHPDKSRISELKGHLNMSQMWMDQIAFQGPSTDYMLPELPDLTIQCLEAIEIIFTVGIQEQSFLDHLLHIDLINDINRGVQEVIIKGMAGDRITLSMVNLQGIKVFEPRTFVMESSQHRVSLTTDGCQLTPGLYCLQVSNQLGDSISRKLLIIN